MSTSNLITRLTDLNGRLRALPSKLGIPQYQNVVLEFGNTQTLLAPNPEVLQVHPGEAEKFIGLNNVDIKSEYFWVKGIPRSYSLSLLQRSNYLLNAVQSQSGVWTGTRATVDYIDKNQMLSWNIFVKKQRSL